MKNLFYIVPFISQSGYKRQEWRKIIYVWVGQVLKLPMNDKVDLLGGEDIFFFNHVNQGQTRTFKSVCSESDCPEEVSLKVNHILSFSQPSDTVKNLEDGINGWIANEKYVLCNKHNCHGTRKYRSRQFISRSVPRYFEIELSLCPWAANLPLTLTVAGHIY